MRDNQYNQSNSLCKPKCGKKNLDENILEEFRRSLKKEKAAEVTIKNYLSDVRQFLNWTKTFGQNIDRFQETLLGMGLSPFSVKRKLSSLRKFSNFSVGNNYLKSSLKFLPSLKPQPAPSFESRRNYLIPSLFLLLILLLFFGGYLICQFFGQKKVPTLKTQTLTTQVIAPVSPTRTLVFSGRLTDEMAIPIISQTAITFRLYDAAENTNILYTSDSCKIKPDKEGLFSTILGRTCGQEIPVSVFYENMAVYLGIQLGEEEEMKPRQQIPTAAYAVNSQTLEGYPASKSPGPNFIPVIDEHGQLVLSASSPKILSTSGTFALEGQAMTIKTSAESEGNITLAPEGAGLVNLIFQGAMPGTAQGFVNAQNANLLSGSLYYGAVGSNSQGFELLKLESGEPLKTRFAVDESGNTFVGGNLNLEGGAIGTESFGNLNLGNYNTNNIYLSPQGVASVIVSPEGTIFNKLIKDGGLGFYGTSGLPLPVTFDFTKEATIEFDFKTGTKNFEVKANLDTSGKQYYLFTWEVNNDFAIKKCNPSCAILAKASLTFSANSWHHGRIYLSPSTLAWELDVEAQRVETPVSWEVSAQKEGRVEFSPNISAISNLRLTSGSQTILTSGEARVGDNLKVRGDITLDGRIYSGGDLIAGLAEGEQGYWQRRGGSLSPLNISDDLLIGATATSSALIKLTGTSGNNSWINTGNLGIGTTSPGTKLAVAGLTGTSSYNYVRVDTSTGNFYYDSSSERYKSDIIPLADDFTRILEAEPKSFIDKISGQAEIGFIAEALDALGLTNLVIYKDGRPEAVKYEKVPLYLLEIVKDQKKRLNELVKQEEKLTSPLVESQESDIVIKLGQPHLPGEEDTSGVARRDSPEVGGAKDGFGKLLVKGQNEEVVASIDALGNVYTEGDISARSASFSGALTSPEVQTQNLEAQNVYTEGLQARNATISGELTAQTVNSKQLTAQEVYTEGLQARGATISGTLFAQEIKTEEGSLTELLSKIKESNNEASPSGLLDQIKQMREWVAKISSSNLALDSQELNNLTMTAPLTFSNGLTVFGKTSLSETMINGTMLIDGSLSLTGTSLANFLGTLYLQPVGGGVDIAGGKVVINETGDMTVEGNLLAKAGITTNMISPQAEEDLVINLSAKDTSGESITPDEEEGGEDTSGVARRDSPEVEGTKDGFGKLLIKGQNNEIVTSIDASGNVYTEGNLAARSANFADQVTASSLALEADYQATSSGVIIAAAQNYLETGIFAPGIRTNATTGLGILPAGQTEFTIFNPAVSDKTLIYVSALSPTQNKVLFVSSKKDGEYFRIAIDQPIESEIKFNWWIIN